MINVKEHGAKGDGATDDTQAIRLALGAGTGCVYFPAGTYRVSGQLNVPKNMHILGDGVEATIVTAERSPLNGFHEAVFYFSGGGFQKLPNMSHRVRRFDVSLKLNSVAHLQADDVVVIIDPADGSYSKAKSDFNAGEYVQISEINGQLVLLVGALQAGYDPEPTKPINLLKMVEPTRSSIRGMTVLGTANEQDNETCCIRFQCGRGVTVRDVRLASSHYSVLQFRQCYGACAENVEADYNFAQSSLSGLNYGISVANCQDVRIANCRITALRHAVTIGGYQGSDDSTNPVNRHVPVSNCDLKTTGPIWALDCHGNGESFTFENNRIHGGIDFGGNLGRIIENEIYGRDGKMSSIPIYGDDWKGTEFEIRGNRIHTVAVPDMSSKFGSIYLRTDGNTTTSGPTIISNNRVFMQGTPTICSGINAVHNSVTPWSLIVDGNDFYHDGDSRSHLVVSSVGSSPFECVIVRNNTFRNGGIERSSIPDSVWFSFGNWPAVETKIYAESVVLNNDQLQTHDITITPPGAVRALGGWWSFQSGDSASFSIGGTSGSIPTVSDRSVTFRTLKLTNSSSPVHVIFFVSYVG
jgi:hypothetical protein